ncbi:helix-turn-helix domain-containing protein [Methanothermococcus sp.]|uniref:helix-turn-helix domain-containing protein n=1 Tax=Methanothermococcus sp. TaxID=2614238 RepID=UPI0025CF7A2F|nr:helix-turn-helix domain-containing protein [Methanothermococcus sp.]
MAKLMIKTPCSTFTLESIMCCMFGIKTFDVAVYLLLLKNGASRVNDIAELLNRDRSTIQRSVQNLVNAGLVKRKQINLREGGYFYKYKAIPFSEVKEIIKDTMEKWCKEVKEWIDELGNEDLEKITKEIICVKNTD